MTIRITPYDDSFSYKSANTSRDQFIDLCDGDGERIDITSYNGRDTTGMHDEPRNEAKTYNKSTDQRLRNTTEVSSTETILNNFDTNCNEVTRVVFIKTHKTASSTLASITQRFGYTRNLSFVVPSRYQIISNAYGFKRSMLNSTKYPPLNGGKHYDILTNHVGYDRHEMEAVIPNATYITILRHPVQQLVSAFSYFAWGKAIGRYRGRNTNLITAFMEIPELVQRRQLKLWWQSHNGQLYDFGFRTQYGNNEMDDLVHKYIEILDKEMDLVLITEYFDESLLIMKKQLCWSMDDILYISKGLGASHHIITQQTRDKILNWNRGDLLFYQHFNRTLWEKIIAYGPTFEKDLQEFRDKLEELRKLCVDPSTMDTEDSREKKYILKSNPSNRCSFFFFDDMSFTDLIRNKQMK
ncbi:galactose-3-O-sulfotransferase 2-like [Saccoglossus kowalevskii]|uniref:Galactosylceramide sulfotransferase-like n=1 Tax=Saccoglossus kowalevskii TaxID=10224 RepID=A0ABM0GVZ7_SACKO|nr:PREDICTED: galactosylceramide sulfotransferase-like [Saccoglossus kowalevskii]